MAEKRLGPLTVITHTCGGCLYHESEYYCVEDGNDVDSGFNHRCSHFGGRRIGYDDKTPDWCPYLATPTPGDRKP